MKKLFTFFAALCLTAAVFAHDFEVDGIYYKITSDVEPYAVAVSFEGEEYDSYSNEYTDAVVIPASVIYGEKTYAVTSIGYAAFYGCSGITSITIGNAIDSIGDWAFSWCEELLTVAIPSSVTSIGKKIFSCCFKLTAVNVDSENPNYCSVDGVLFDKAKTTLVVYPAGKAGTEYTIPSSVTAIGEEAFSGCALTSVTIPDAVTSIPNHAFAWSESLSSIVIPNSVTTIDSYAFYSCESLTSVTIGNSVTTIGKYAFASCFKLASVTIPNSVTSIGEGVFWYCEEMSSATIGKSVTEIGKAAFKGCTALLSITCGAVTPPACGANCFESVDKAIPLYVPAGSIASYGAAAEWSDFTNVVAITTAVNQVVTESIYAQAGRISCAEPFEVYTIAGVNVTRQNGNLPSGAYIVKTAQTATKVSVN